jgi:hypothetical protein
MWLRGASNVRGCDGGSRSYRCPALRRLVVDGARKGPYELHTFELPPKPVTPKPPDRVEVYISKQPERPSVEMGLLEAKQQSQYSVDDQGAIINELRAKAGEVGCDGVIILGSADTVVGATSTTTENQTSPSTSTGTSRTSVHTLKGYRASCIVYTN